MQSLVNKLYALGEVELARLKNTELRQLARDLRLSGYSRMNKEELLSLISTNVVMYHGMLNTIREARSLGSELQEATSELWRGQLKREVEALDSRQEAELMTGVSESQAYKSEEELFDY